MTILVTGGAGFIGSNFVLDWLAQSDEPVVNLDKLTYAGNLQNLASLEGNANHVFVKGDFGDAWLVSRLLDKHKSRDCKLRWSQCHRRVWDHHHRGYELDNPARYTKITALEQFNGMNILERWVRNTSTLSVPHAWDQNRKA